MTTPDQPDMSQSEQPISPAGAGEEETLEVTTDVDPGTAEAVEASAEGTVDTTPEVPPARRTERVFVGTGLFWGLVFGVILAVAFIILAAQNTVETPVRFLGWEMTTPLIALILVSFLAGVILDELVGLIYRARRRRILQDREELRALRDRET